MKKEKSRSLLKKATLVGNGVTWDRFESIKALEIKTYMLFNLDFARNTILSCFFFFFLIIYLYFFIPAVITQIFNPVAEIVIPIGIPTKEAKVEIETHSVITETTISG